SLWSYAMQFPSAFRLPSEPAAPLFGPPASLQSRDIRLTGQTMFVMRDEEIFSKDDAILEVYQVKKGAVRGFDILSNRRRQIYDFYLPGDIFGVHLIAAHR